MEIVGCIVKGEKRNINCIPAMKTWKPKDDAPVKKYL